jgi:hypothetical protein
LAVTAIEIRSRREYAGNASFGSAGRYERLDGIVRFAVNPEHERNQGIVDLEKAPRDPACQVVFWSDFTVLKPVEMSLGSRRLLFEVVNRGRKNAPRQLNRAPADLAPTTDRIDPGDGFLLRHGFTLAWCGWQWDVVSSPALMGLEAPLAMENGQPIGGRTIVQFQPNLFHRTHLLADRNHRPYPAASLNDDTAILTVQDYQEGPTTVISRRHWRFGREDGGRVIPDATRLYLAEGFEPGRIYALTYQTNIAPVVGVGLLAVRDCASFLRRGTAANGNPVAGSIDYAYGFGVSQSARFLRHFLYLGLNLDEEGLPAFDGVLAHVGGGRRGEFNHRFAQPSVNYTPNFGYLFPFADDDLAEPGTGKVDGLLKRQRTIGGLPKIFYTNTAAEYWRGDGALQHIDATNNRDITPPEEVRIYHFSSAQHGPGSLPLIDTNPNDASSGRHYFNILDYSPLTRAALLNLDAWVTEGKEPPPSAYPRLADGAALLPENLEPVFRDIPGAVWPDLGRIFRLGQLDLGPKADQGIGVFPAKIGRLYPNPVSAVDACGNEIAGVRMPDLEAPVATYTGWNPRHPATGEPGQIIRMLGSTFPLPATEEERSAAQDPRTSIAERYANRDDYLSRIRTAARSLVAQGYLLGEDIQVVVDNAAARYDLIVGNTKPK